MHFLSLREISYAFSKFLSDFVDMKLKYKFVSWVALFLLHHIGDMELGNMSEVPQFHNNQTKLHANRSHFRYILRI
jgi:hypothetical protein